MANKQFPLALKGSSALARLESNEMYNALERRTRKQIKTQIQEMARTACEATIAQKALGWVYYHTLAMADDTLTAAEFLKAARLPLPHVAELDQLETVRRQSYLMAMNDVAEDANQKIKERHNRKRG